MSRMAEREDHLDCVEVVGGNRRIDRAAGFASVDAWILCSPQGEAAEGGDIAFLTHCGRARLVKGYLADVTGHGCEVAPAARALHDLVRNYMHDHDQVSFLKVLNREAEALGGLYATMATFTISVEESRLVSAYAGQLGLAIRASGERCFVPQDLGYCPVPGAFAGLAIGMVPGTKYFQSAVPFRHGDTVVVYSDGYTDAVLPGGERLGSRAFHALLERVGSTSAEGIRHEIEGRLPEEHPGIEFPDDRSLIVLVGQ